MPRLLDLPPDITTQIFSYFDRGVDVQNLPSMLPHWDGLATLQACRLTCRGLNELVSGLLCPFFRGSLDKASVARIEHLSRNPLIAEGMRAVEINLAFRPKAIASDLTLYCEHVTEKVDGFKGMCYYWTEFQHYEDEEQSDDAVKHRSLLAAQERLYLIRESWRQCVESEAYRTADVSAQQLLRDCFPKYARLQLDEEEIVSDGSFVNIFAAAMVRFKHPAYLSFVDEANPYPRSDGVAVANDSNLLAKEMLQPHDWLSIEKMSEEATLLSARLLVELPIACARLGARLQGLDIGCFPLTRLFTSLIPPNTTDDRTNLWSELSDACRELEMFRMGRRGMHSTPSRQQRICPEDCEIVDGYLGAACSSPKLETAHIAMIPFRKCGGSKFRDGVSPDLYYQAGNFLRRLNSSSLTHIDILYVEISGSDLESMVSTLPRYHMKKIRLCNVTLNEGDFASTMESLRAIKTGSTDCDIDLSGLSGGEFGPAQGFDERGGWLFMDDEEQDDYWERLEEHTHPPLLRAVIAYVCGEGEANPSLIDPKAPQGHIV